MLSALSGLGGVAPTTGLANAVFQAPNGVTLGSFDFFGDYLYLISDQVTLTQAINTYTPGSETLPVINPNVVVQFSPFTPGRAIAVEHSLPTSTEAGTTYYTNLDHFQRFPGTSIFVGGTAYGGAVNIGQNGVINIGGQNFLVSTGGALIGAGNILSTGIVGANGILVSGPATSPPTVPITTGGVTTVVQQANPTDPTDPGGTTITEETVQTNLPTEEQTLTDTTPLEDPIDFIALLEQQPLVQGEVLVNTTMLTCQ